MNVRHLASGVAAGALLCASAAFGANAAPTITTFSVPTSAVSPVPITALRATDSDGTVAGYLITTTSTKPAATAPGWTSTAPTSYATGNIGSVTLYAWAKDNLNAVSNAVSKALTVVGSHLHAMADVSGLTTALAAKADTAALVGKADVTHAHSEADVTGLANDLAGKAPAVHGHSQGDVAGLAAALAAKADATALAAKADVSALEGKADVSALAGKADLGHNHDTVYQKKYSHVITVSPVFGEADFTDPDEAVASVTDSSDTNRYLVRLMPGIYQPRWGRLLMKSYVDVEGAGKQLTRIKGGNPGCPLVDAGAGVTEAELRNVTVEATQGYGIESLYSITNVAVVSNGHGIGLSMPVRYMYLKGVEVTAAWDAISCTNNHISTVLIEDVTILDGQNGIVNIGDGWGGAKMTIRNVGIHLTRPNSIGVLTNGGFDMTIEASRINATGKGIDATNSTFMLRDVFVNSAGDGSVPAIAANGYGEVQIFQGRYVGSVTAPTLKAAGAQFSTAIPTGKLVNCFNGNFELIPNQ